MTEGVAEQKVRSVVSAPLVRWRRARSAGLDQASRQMLEAVDYRRSMLDFMTATVKDPDILVTAPLDESSTVVDAGAFVGEWAQAIVAAYGCDVLAVEAVPEIAAEMQRRIGPGSSITCVTVALGAEDGRVEMEYLGPGSRITAGPVSDPSHVVDVRDVDQVLREHGVDHIDLLKMNIEGGEFDVIDRLLETGWLDRIDVLLVQFHPHWPGAPRRRRRIRRALRQTHVEDWDYPWVWERWVRREVPDPG